MPDLTGLSHAGGPAADTGVHLIALTGADAGAVAAASDHLDTAVIPGAVATAATAPVAEYAIAVLAAGQVSLPAARVELLYFLGQVTEAAQAPAAEPGVIGCRALLPEILRVAEHCEGDTSEQVREEAADTAESALEAIDTIEASGG
ncbi:hypothetical protein [Nakamurella aerolata]|uniref:Uncharacterized protein n=1 Tax=Nakamurella aerolata TaxID=1656892 RepID=A0A849A817_9ACTN|nr:hypothetical protein [Nakamurella aerolata]NNG37124.1 hypothetical protein [Nakamurella aerolata]